MQINKILEKIHGQIHQLAPRLELFLDESVQPSVSDSESLQQLLRELQDQVAVYKYCKQDRELSPSFNLHAKVSENIAGDMKNEAVVNVDASLKDTETIHKEKIEAPGTYAPLTVGINDKFRMINELFKQNSSEYNIAIEQLNALHSWHESELYLNSLKMIYGWKDDSEIARLLYSITKKRFA